MVIEARGTGWLRGHHQLLVAIDTDNRIGVRVTNHRETPHPAGDYIDPRKGPQIRATRGSTSSARVVASAAQPTTARTARDRLSRRRRDDQRVRSPLPS